MRPDREGNTAWQLAAEKDNFKVLHKVGVG